MNQPPADPLESFVRDTVKRIADAYLARTSGAPARWSVEAFDIDHFARALLRAPSGQKLSAPRRTNPPLGTRGDPPPASRRASSVMTLRLLLLDDIAADQLTLSSGPAFRLDEGAFQRAFSTALDPRLSDLLRIAMRAFAADRLTRRRLPRRGARDPHGLGWARCIDLHVPVRDPGFWRSRREAFDEILSWLSGDAWRLDFGKSRDAPERGRQEPLFAHRPESGAVALFSGGLDSLAGAAHDLDRGVDKALLLVGAARRPACRRPKDDSWRGS